MCVLGGLAELQSPSSVAVYFLRMQSVDFKPQISLSSLRGCVFPHKHTHQPHS